MANQFHKDLTLDDIHTLPARIYDDVAARDADTDFNGDATNLYKSVFTEAEDTLFLLIATTPVGGTWATTMISEIPGIDSVLNVDQDIDNKTRNNPGILNILSKERSKVGIFFIN